MLLLPKVNVIRFIPIRSKQIDSDSPYTENPLAKASQRLHEGPSYPSQRRWTSNVNYVINMGSSGSFQPFADQRSAFGEDFSFSSESVPPTTWLQLTEVDWERLVDFWSLIRVLRGHGIENYPLLCFRPCLAIWCQAAVHRRALLLGFGVFSSIPSRLWGYWNSGLATYLFPCGRLVLRYLEHFLACFNDIKFYNPS